MVAEKKREEEDNLSQEHEEGCREGGGWRGGYHVLSPAADCLVSTSLHLAPLPHTVLLHQLGGRQEVVVLEVIMDGPKHLVQEGLHGAVEVPGHTR